MIERWTKGCILHFSKKGDLRIAKNYRDITLTSIAAKIYNVLLLNRIKPEIEKIFKKILTIHQIIVVCVEKLQDNTHICRFLQGIRLHT